MFNFKKTQTVSDRVSQVTQATIEVRGEAWLLSLGHGPCNDFAQLVTNTVSQESGFEHIRFETVARYIRARKAKLRALQAIAAIK